MGDIISVKPGYARNFLLPQRKALRATEENLKKFKEQRAKLEALNLETKQEAEKIKEEIDGRSFIVIRSASETGSLYGSVTARDAEKAMGLESLVVKRKQIILAKPIKELGLHELDISLAVIRQNLVAIQRSNLSSPPRGLYIFTAPQKAAPASVDHFP